MLFVGTLLPPSLWRHIFSEVHGSSNDLIDTFLNDIMFTRCECFFFVDSSHLKNCCDCLTLLNLSPFDLKLIGFFLYKLFDFSSRVENEYLWDGNQNANKHNDRVEKGKKRLTQNESY